MSLALDPGTRMIADPRDAAESVGLRYVSDDEPGLRRRKTGMGFS
jgi:DNA topoisomerase I